MPRFPPSNPKAVLHEPTVREVALIVHEAWTEMEGNFRDGVTTADVIASLIQMMLALSSDEGSC